MLIALGLTFARWIEAGALTALFASAFIASSAMNGLDFVGIYQVGPFGGMVKPTLLLVGWSALMVALLVPLRMARSADRVTGWLAEGDRPRPSTYCGIYAAGCLLEAILLSASANCFCLLLRDRNIAGLWAWSGVVPLAEVLFRRFPSRRKMERWARKLARSRADAAFPPELMVD